MMSTHFKTVYAMHAFSNAANNPNSQYEHSTEAVDRLLNQLLIGVGHDGMYPEDFKVRFDGKQLDAVEAFEYVAPHIDRLRMKAIGIFENYFSRQTDVGQFIRDFDSGLSEAVKAIKFMGIFPIEAIEVRNELAFPALLRQRAAMSEDQESVSITILRGIMGPIGFYDFRGPHLPPLSTDSLVEHLRNNVGQFDQLARQCLAGVTPFPAAESNDGPMGSGPPIH